TAGGFVTRYAGYPDLHAFPTRRSSDLDYYLEGAGGFSNRASKGKVSVKYANGEVRTRKRALFFASDPRPGPGSEVFAKNSARFRSEEHTSELQSPCNLVSRHLPEKKSS